MGADRMDRADRTDRGDPWVVDRSVYVLGQKPAHPAHAFALDDMIDIDPFVQPRKVGDVSTDEDRGAGQAP